MTIFLKNTLGPLWLIIVFSYYIRSYPNFASSFSDLSPVITLVVAWIVMFLILGGFLFWKKKKNITITPAKILLAVFVFSLVTGATLYAYINPGIFAEPYQMVPYAEGQFAVVEEGVPIGDDFGVVIKRGTVFQDWDYFKQVIPAEILPMFKTKSTLAFAGTLAINLLKIIGSWLFFIVLFHNLGATILRQKKPQIFEFFKSVGVGIVLFMGLMFVLGLLGLLQPVVLWIITILALILGVSKMPLIWKIFAKSKVKISLSKEKWWLPLVVIAIGIPTALNIVETTKPYPGGFDSMFRYHNTPNLLAQYGSLVEHLPAYNYELIFGLGRILFNSTMIGASLSILGAFLGFSLLFVLLNKKFTWGKSFLLTAVFVSLPMIQFMLALDLKTDLPLLFFSLLAVYEALKSRYKWASLWLGICLGIKYTSVLLVFTYFAYLAFNFWGVLAATGMAVLSIGMLSLSDYLYFWHEKLFGLGLVVAGLSCLIFAWKKVSPTKKQLKTFFVSGLLIIGLFSPWLIKGAVETHSFSIKNLLDGGYTEFQAQIKNQPVLETCHFAAYGDEIARYSGYFKGSDLLLPLVTIWDSTVVSGEENNNMRNISFLFLGLLLFGVFSYKEMKKNDHDYKKITAFTGLYILLWALTSQGVIWYGLPMFLGLLTFYGGAFKTEKWPYIVIAVWLVMALFLRVYVTGSDTKNLFYAGGLYDDDIYFETADPGSVEIMAILNSEENLSKKVYVAGGAENFFIEHNDQRVYRDFLLNDFYCYFYDSDENVVLEKLRANDIDYVFFAAGNLDYERDSENIMEDRINWFKSFTENYLNVEVYRPEGTLYSVPS